MRTVLRLRFGEMLAACALAALIGCGGTPDTGLGGDEDSGADSSDGGGGDVQVDAPKDARADSTIDTTPDGPTDSGVDTRRDSMADTTDTAPETIADSGSETSADSTSDSTPDSVADTTDSAPDSIADSTVDSTIDSTADSVAETTTDSGIDTTDSRICTPGTLCSDGTICTGGTACTPCSLDTDCSSIVTGTLCYGGKCLFGTCHPKPTTPSGCTTGQACCATSTAAGTCFSPSTGGTACCDDTDCASLPALTKCDKTAHTCVCPDPTPGLLVVGSKGSDTTGNGSSSCPFQTITHALTVASASPATTWTINLLNDFGGANTEYGVPCSAGGTLCDPSPIVIGHTFTGGVTIQGPGASQINVSGSDGASAVFVVRSPNVSFTGITVNVNNVTTPGDGIVFLAGAATGTEGSVTNVVINGKNGPSVSTGSDIRIAGGTSPTIGPGVTLNGGQHGILVTDDNAAGAGASKPTFTSSAAAKSSITNTNVACVRVDTRAAGTPGPTPSMTITTVDAGGTIQLMDCGGRGGIVVDTVTANLVSVSNVDVRRTPGNAAAQQGIDLLRTAALTMTNVTVSGLGGSGIVSEDNSTLTITSSVTSNGNFRGIYLTGNATATISGLTASNNVGSGAGAGAASDGLRCDGNATIKVRGSTFLGNAANGVSAYASCVPDMGAATGDLGSNTFNTTTMKNSIAGLCVTTSAVLGVTASSSTWSCGYAGAGCTTSGSPTTGFAIVSGTGAVTCQEGRDIDTRIGGPPVAAPKPTCCD